ncbi:GNAT family N-acetyltransferase [Salinivirga cyanobacteriivorans]
MKLETNRLTIRPITPADKHAVYAYRRDKVTNQFQGWIPETPDDVEVFIEKSAKQINEPETWFQLILIEKATDKIVGDIGIHFFGSENRQAEIGVTLNRNYQKKGYATESIKKVIDYLFNTLNKHRIITSIDPENASSIKLVERLGFRKEAHFVESIYMNGKWVDDLIYAMLEKDWQNFNFHGKPPK